MTIILKNVDEKFLLKVKDFSQSINAKCEIKKEKVSKEKIIENTIEDFLLPKNYAVFERLKDK